METILYQVTFNDGRIYRINCRGKNQKLRFKISAEKLKTEITSNINKCNLNNNIMKSVSNLKIELSSLKDYVIGIFEQDKHFELVMNYDKVSEQIDTFRITSLGATQQYFQVPIQFGKLKMFNNNKTMNQMLDNPFKWVEFMEGFN